ncbi:MAG TPA: LLM class flavin-dependent oxidoreductase [Gemmatimonadales bacterium]|nr:LLM class flavin-dependent oxidoreductase [Gemmatimonadales bacterium]
MRDSGLKIFSTCPQSKDVRRAEYPRAVADVARWSEAAGCCGILVYADNGLVDPWLVSQLIIQHTESLSPLVAIQPVYMHPYAAAKMVATLSHLHGRRLYLNMIAGGFRNDLLALNDPTPHDERYDRVVEYTLIMKALLSGPAPVSFQGNYYRITNLRMTPPLPPELSPGLLMSGSSEAGLNAAKATGAIPVRYPEPPGAEGAATPGSSLDRASADVPAAGTGIRVGVIARESPDDAWRIAHERFPEDRKGQLTHQLAMKTSDSKWHEQLTRLGAQQGDGRHPYWLTPFENYKTFCPYLVGSYRDVARELSRYVRAGVDTIILDIPPSREELNHIAATFEMLNSERPA